MGRLTRALLPRPLLGRPLGPARGPARGPVLGAALALGLVLALAGCGTDRTGRAEDPPPAGASSSGVPTPPAPVERPPEPGSTTPPATRLSSSPDLHARPTSCAGASTRVAAVFLDAALGHRYLAVELVSCTDRPLVLRGLPAVALRTSSGRSAVASVRAWERRPPVRLAPGGRALLGLEYLAADQKPRVTALTLRVAGDEHVLTGALDLDARTRITGYPWVAQGEDLFAS